MLDTMHKILLAGVGLAAMTKDKIDEHVKELVEKGKLSEKEGRQLADDILKKSKQAKEDIQKQVEESVQKVIKTFQMASKHDLDELASRVAKLEESAKTK